MRTRYQFGSVYLQERKHGPAVWVYRFFDPEGRRKAVRIGTTEQHPNEISARKAAEQFMLLANAENPTAQVITFGAVVDLYLKDELPERKSTRTFYKPWINNHILPKWREWNLDKLSRSPFAIEQWLKTLKLAPKSKANIRSLMRVIFDCAMRWGFLPNQPNPMSLVRIKGVSKRMKQPRILTVEQCMAVRAQLPEPYKTMALVAMCLGLRVSEILGLQWRDFDWEKLQVYVRRAVVLGTEGDVKTVYSSKQVPLDPALAEVLFTYRGTFGKGAEPEAWVFANPDTGRPWWAHQIQQRYIRKAGNKALELDGIGWHTFRHTYSSLLRELGVDVKVQQELLRHSDIRTTLNIYTQAVPRQLREANSQVVRLFLGDVTLADSGNSAKRM